MCGVYSSAVCGQSTCHSNFVHLTSYNPQTGSCCCDGLRKWYTETLSLSRLRAERERERERGPNTNESNSEKYPAVASPPSLPPSMLTPRPKATLQKFSLPSSLPSSAITPHSALRSVERRRRLQARVAMQRLSYLTETVLTNKITRQRIVPSFKDSPEWL